MQTRPPEQRRPRHSLRSRERRRARPASRPCRDDPSLLPFATPLRHPTRVAGSPQPGPDVLRRTGTELGQRLREAGQQILRDELAKADVDAESVLIDGVEHRRVLRATETYMTTEGPVTAMRSLYRDYSDPGAKAVAALEARMGIVGGFWTAEAAKQATWVVSQMTPALSEELFARVGTIRPSKSSLDRASGGHRHPGERHDDRRACRGGSRAPPPCRRRRRPAANARGRSGTVGGKARQPPG